MQASNVAADAVQARLTDALFAVKNTIEDRDIARFRGLFAENPQICIQGRFIPLGEFLERLEEFFKRVEHISMDVTRIEEIDEAVEGGFIAGRVDFGWIDSKLWEEQQMSGVVGLTLARAGGRTTKGTKAAGGEGQATAPISGFAYNALPLDTANGGREPNGGGTRDGTTGVGPQPSPSRGGYSFWG